MSLPFHSFCYSPILLHTWHHWHTEKLQSHDDIQTQSHRCTDYVAGIENLEDVSDTTCVHHVHAWERENEKANNIEVVAKIPFSQQCTHACSFTIRGYNSLIQFFFYKSHKYILHKGANLEALHRCLYKVPVYKGLKGGSWASDFLILLHLGAQEGLGFQLGRNKPPAPSDYTPR